MYMLFKNPNVKALLVFFFFIMPEICCYAHKMISMAERLCIPILQAAQEGSAKIFPILTPVVLHCITIAIIFLTKL